MFPYPFSFLGTTESGLAQLDNNYYMQFDGVDDKIVVPYNTNLQFGKTQEYSISCWIYAPSYIIASKKIFGTGTFATAAYMANGTHSGGLYSVYWRMGGTWPTSAGYFMSVSSGYTLSQATWYNIIITYDGSELGAGLKMYINGAAPIVSTTNWGANAQDSLNSNDFIISLDTVTGWPGRMDEIAIWRNELSATDVANIYDATDIAGKKCADLSSMTTPPVAWYRMGD